MSRRSLWLVLVFLMFVPACAGDDTSEDSSAARQVEDVVPAKVVDPITLRLAVPEWSGDPADASATDLSARVLAGLVFEQLTALDRTGAAVPNLAESWDYSVDRRSLTFHLPADATFANGDQITGQDVIDSLDRIAARGSNDPAAAALMPISGWKERADGQSALVIGLSAPDPQTVIIGLNEPFEMLPEVLAAPVYGIGGAGEAEDLRASGDYRIESPKHLVAVEAGAPVQAIELIDISTSAAEVIDTDAADWVVLGEGESLDALPGDVVRVPIELLIDVVVRGPEAERTAIASRFDTRGLRASLWFVTPLGASTSPLASDLPAGLVVDVPEGPLEPLAAEMAKQLGGIEVVVSDRETFAARVADGTARVFPYAFAGGSGMNDLIARALTPGSVDDVFRAESADRTSLAEALRAEADPVERAGLVMAFTATAVEERSLVEVGQGEIRVAIGPRLRGLSHNDDGTLNLDGVSVSDG